MVNLACMACCWKYQCYFCRTKSHDDVRQAESEGIVQTPAVVRKKTAYGRQEHHTDRQVALLWIIKVSPYDRRRIRRSRDNEQYVNFNVIKSHGNSDESKYSNSTWQLNTR